MTKCPECRKKVSDMAESCPKCGYGVASHIMKIKAELEKKKKAKPESGCLHMISIVLFFSFLGFIVYELFYAPRNPENFINKKPMIEKIDPTGGEVHAVWVATQEYVEGQLLSPSSAKFRFGGFRDVVNLGNDRYRVDSYVDAQNGFGAEIRRKFTCEVIKIKGGWGIKNFQFEE